MAMRNLFPNSTALIEPVDILNTDVPFLISLDFLDEYRM